LREVRLAGHVFPVALGNDAYPFPEIHEHRVIVGGKVGRFVVVHQTRVDGARRAAALMRATRPTVVATAIKKNVKRFIMVAPINMLR
jgi:hypothetical protein